MTCYGAKLHILSGGVLLIDRHLRLLRYLDLVDQRWRYWEAMLGHRRDIDKPLVVACLVMRLLVARSEERYRGSDASCEKLALLENGGVVGRGARVRIAFVTGRHVASAHR